MGKFQSHANDSSTYALNLAPMLDIIVSIIPMLLLSVVFVKITVIDTPLPQAVQDAIAQQKDKKDEVSVLLRMEKAKGLEFVVNENGQTQRSSVALLNGGKIDLDGLKKEAIAVKQKHPQLFHLDLAPDEKFSLDEIVLVMDTVRKVNVTDARIAFNDPKTGSRMETDLLFPSVTFSNVMGD